MHRRVAERGGDAVFARFGLSPSEVVRAVWQYAVDRQSVPECVSPRDADSAAETAWRLDLARGGCGLAVRIAREQCGAAIADPAPTDDRPWGAVRDEMYDAMLDEMESRCR